MNPPDSTEKGTLKELQRLFADPVATAKRYRRYCVLCFVGAFACSPVGVVVKHFTHWKDSEAILMLVAGVGIGFGVYFLMGARQAPYLTKYCTLDVEAVQKRLAEATR